MNRDPSYVRHASQIIEAADVATFHHALEQALTDLGVTSLTYHLINVGGRKGPQPLFVSTYPEAWVQRYQREGYIFHDPTVARARLSGSAFRWDDIPTAGPETASTMARRIMGEAGDFGVRHGMTVPVHAPDTFGALSLSLNLPDREALEIHHHGRAAFVMLGMHAHEAARRLLMPGARDLAGMPGGLTNRELDCARWLAEGKTNWEIGQILGISTNTVNAHVTAAMRKLNVHSRAHLVARIVAMGTFNRDCDGDWPRPGRSLRKFDRRCLSVVQPPWQDKP